MCRTCFKNVITNANMSLNVTVVVSMVCARRKVFCKILCPHSTVVACQRSSFSNTNAPHQRSTHYRRPAHASIACMGSIASCCSHQSKAQCVAECKFTLGTQYGSCSQVQKHAPGGPAGVNAAHCCQSCCRRRTVKSTRCVDPRVCAQLLSAHFLGSSRNQDTCPFQGTQKRELIRSKATCPVTPTRAPHHSRAPACLPPLRRRAAQCAAPGVVVPKKSRMSSMGPKFCSCTAHGISHSVRSAPRLLGLEEGFVQFAETG